MTFVDTNVLIDVLQDDEVWGDWSVEALASLDAPTSISPLVYSELASRFSSRVELDRELATLRVLVVEPSRSVLFTAGRAHAAYRARGGRRERVLADFLIGAQASESGGALLTRDPRRYRKDFPDLRLIAPEG